MTIDLHHLCPRARGGRRRAAAARFVRCSLSPRRRDSGPGV